MKKSKQDNNNPAILADIESIVKRELGENAIKDMDVKNDISFDGDPIYRINLLLDKKYKIKPGQKAKLIRRVREEIQDDVERFPIFRFLSNAEMTAREFASL